VWKAIVSCVLVKPSSFVITEVQEESRLLVNMLDFVVEHFKCYLDQSGYIHCLASL